MKRVWFLAVLIYLFCGALTYGAALASFQHQFGIDDDIERAMCRQDMGVAAMFSLLPPAWFVTFFLSGFYQDGFQWRCER